MGLGTVVLLPLFWGGCWHSGFVLSGVGLVYGLGLPPTCFGVCGGLI